VQDTGFSVKFRMKAACDRVTGFRFDKPDGYSFVAGQYLRLTLDTREGRQTKSMSHSSAPSDPFIELATRMSGSAFKDALGELVRGDDVAIAGPFGSLVLPEDVRQVLFLAGGVGITPCRSMIRDAEQRRTGLRMRLFYGNHDQVCVPYSGEFADYERKDRRFKVVGVLEDPLPGWPGERGFITAELVRRYIDTLDGWHCVIAGPPTMVTAMEMVAEQLGIVADQLSVERFGGYET
jgi:ferredoxin-NADP reductase